MLFLCGTGTDSEDTAQKLFQSIKSISRNTGINVQDPPKNDFVGIAYLNNVFVQDPQIMTLKYCLSEYRMQVL